MVAPARHLKANGQPQYAIDRDGPCLRGIERYGYWK